MFLNPLSFLRYETRTNTENGAWNESLPFKLYYYSGALHLTIIFIVYKSVEYFFFIKCQKIVKNFEKWSHQLMAKVFQDSVSFVRSSGFPSWKFRQEHKSHVYSSQDKALEVTK